MSVLLSQVGCSAPDESSETYLDRSQALVLPKVSLQTNLGGQYVGAQNNGGGTVNATANAAQAWEQFSLDDVNGGELVSGDKVFIQAGNGQYFVAQDGGGSTLSAASNNRLGWETFAIQKVGGSGVIRNGDVVALQASNGYFVRAVDGGGSSVDVRGASLQGWEQFKISGLSASTCAFGIEGDGVCCLSSCGSCGGSGCGDRPGGAEACCAGPIKESGVSCSDNAAPCVLGGVVSPPRDTIVHATFQGQSIGTYSRGDVATDFGSTPSWDNGLSQGRARVVQEGSNKFLRVTYPKGKYGPNEGGVQFEVDLKGSYSELFLSYRVRFASNFDFVLGGKLPGFVGGSSPSGCTTDKTGGFSARNMWRPLGKVDQYMYYPDRVNRCGDDWYYSINGSQVSFQRSRWHTIEHRIVMGTAGQGDGILQAWFDGQRALDRRLKWKVGGASYGIDALYFSTFFGGSNIDWAPKSDQIVDFDEFMVSDSPITH